MLTEFLEEIYQPPGPPPELNELDPAESQYWLGARARYERIRQSYIEHLRHMYPGRQVEVRRVEHLIPEILEFQQRPIELTDDSLFRPMLDLPVVLEFDAENLPAVEDASSNGRVGESAERKYQADMPAGRTVQASDSESVSGEAR
jgi:hypothetical protein